MHLSILTALRPRQEPEPQLAVPTGPVVLEPPLYTFRVRPQRWGPGLWRDLQVAANQTLEDLGEAIPTAFDFDDPHLWSFFLSGKRWDRTSEYAGPSHLWGKRRYPAAERVLIRDVVSTAGTRRPEWLFLFDYGDEWHFNVRLTRTSAQLDPACPYPRLADGRGAAPPQYVYPDEED